MISKCDLSRRLRELEAPEEYWMFSLKRTAVKSDDLPPEYGPDILDEETAVVRHNGKRRRITEATVESYAERFEKCLE